MNKRQLIDKIKMLVSAQQTPGLLPEHIELFKKYGWKQSSEHPMSANTVVLVMDEAKEKEFNNELQALPPIDDNIALFVVVAVEKKAQS